MIFSSNPDEVMLVKDEVVQEQCESEVKDNSCAVQYDANIEERNKIIGPK